MIPICDAINSFKGICLDIKDKHSHQDGYVTDSEKKKKTKELEKVKKNSKHEEKEIAKIPISFKDF
jgi:hypothetical protein